jgi:hypothetical protein
LVGGQDAGFQTIAVFFQRHEIVLRRRAEAQRASANPRSMIIDIAALGNATVERQSNIALDSFFARLTLRGGDRGLSSNLRNQLFCVRPGEEDVCCDVQLVLGASVFQAVEHCVPGHRELCILV